MTNQEAIQYLSEALQKAVANKIYSQMEIFAINQSFTKLQENEHSENQRLNPDAQPQEAAKD